MLADIGGKPLIWHTYQQVKKAKLPEKIVVATDSEEIRGVVENFGGLAVMSSPELLSGSDRVAIAAKEYKADIVINVQGDEPMISPEAIDAAAQLLLDDGQALMGTVATPFPNNEDINDPANVKAILDQHGYAMYFSRSVIPHPRHTFTNYLKHLGIYAFRYDFLQKFVTLSETPLQKAESLEQLRALEHGYRIKVAVGNYTSISVDTQADLDRVRAFLKP